MSNGNVGWYYDNSSIPSYRVRGLTIGTTILQITDRAGKVGQVAVTVQPKKAIGIKEIFYTKEVKIGYAGAMRFDTFGDPAEVGVEYTLANGTKESIILDKQSDGIYMI